MQHFKVHQQQLQKLNTYLNPLNQKILKDTMKSQLNH
jgi:hypothetical protein